MSSNTIESKILQAIETILRVKLAPLKKKYQKIPQLTDLLIALVTRGKDQNIERLRREALEFHLYQYDIDTLLKEFSSSKLPRDIETISQKMIQELENALEVFGDIYRELFQLEEREILPKGGTVDIICHLNRTDELGALKGTILEGRALKELFNLGEILGEGAYSIVQKGFYKPLGKECTIKFLNHTTSLLFAKRFLAEGFQGYLISSKLRKEEGNQFEDLMEIYDFGGLLPIKENKAPFFFIVSEYIGGKTLFSWSWKNRKNKEKSYSLRDKHFQKYLKLSLQMVRGVQKLHSLGYVHGDINSLNFMVYTPDWGDNPKIKLIDYGSILPIDSEPFEDHMWSWGSSQSKGAKRYRPPEYTAFFSTSPVERMKKRVRPFVDIFSLGVTLFDLFTDMEFAVGEVADPEKIKAEHFSPFRGFSEIKDDILSKLPQWLSQIFQRSVEFYPPERIPLNHIYNVLEFAIQRAENPPSLDKDDIETLLNSFWEPHKITEELNKVYQGAAEQLEPEILATPAMPPNEFFQEKSGKYSQEILELKKKYRSAIENYNTLDFIWDPQFHVCPNLLCREELPTEKTQCPNCGVQLNITCSQCGEKNNYFNRQCQNHSCRREFEISEKVEKALKITIKYAENKEDRTFQLPSSILRALIAITLYREYLNKYLPPDKLGRYLQELKTKLYHEEEKLQREIVSKLSRELQEIFQKVREEGLRYLRIEKYKRYHSIIKQKIAQRAYVDAIELITSIKLESQSQNENQSLPEEKEIIQKILEEKDNLIIHFLSEDLELIEKREETLKEEKERVEKQLENCQQSSNRYFAREKTLTENLHSLEKKLQHIKEIDRQLHELLHQIEKETSDKFIPDDKLIERILKNPQEEPELWEITPIFLPKKFQSQLDETLKKLSVQGYYLKEESEKLKLPGEYRKLWGQITASIEAVQREKDTLDKQINIALSEIEEIKNSELSELKKNYQSCREMLQNYEKELLKLGELLDNSQRKLGELFREDPREYLPEKIQESQEIFKKNIEFINNLTDKLYTLRKKNK